MRKRKYTPETVPVLFIESGRNVEYELLDASYAFTSKGKLSVRHLKCGNVFRTSCHHFFSRKQGCAICAGNQQKYTSNTTPLLFSNNLKSNDYELLDCSNVTNGHSKFTVKHKICKRVSDIEVLSFLRGRGGCTYCGGRAPKYTQENFLTVWGESEHSREYELIDFSNVLNAQSYFTLKHKKCETIYEVRCHKFFYTRQGCPVCKQSKGEARVHNYLIKSNIDFVRQYQIEGCAKILQLKFDFFIPIKNLIIEYHGQQHYKPNERFGGNPQFLKQQEYDSYKKDYAIEKGFTFLEIPFTEFKNIERILKLALAERS